MAITVKKRTVNLAHYYPNTVYPSKEFQTLANIGDDELNKIWSEAWQLMLNTFVYDLNELGASRWEEMLNIYPAPDDSLEMRKQAILFKINNKLPYTERSFQNMVDGIYGVGKVKIIIEHDEYNIRFELEPDVMRYYSGLWKYSRVVVPANMGIYAIVRNAMTCSIYFGAKMLRAGRKVIDIKSLEKATNAIYSGVAYYKGGRKKLRLKEPIRPYSAINLGSMTVKTGRKVIPCREEDIR